MLPLSFFSTAADKKRQCYPLCFIRSQRQEMTVLFRNDNKTLLPLMFYSKMTMSKQQQLYALFKNDNEATVLPLAFLADKKRQCYPFRFFQPLPIKRDSVTPYIFFYRGR